MVAAAKGCRCRIAMPDDAALEKSQLLRALGAHVQRVRPVSITHPGHFVNVARRVGVTPPAFLWGCCNTMGKASQGTASYIIDAVKLDAMEHVVRGHAFGSVQPWQRQGATQSYTFQRGNCILIRNFCAIDLRKASSCMQPYSVMR